ncbi:hypothetical protein HPB47_010972 [Ixodes persulcatus]|uniref:Uncharacterized protein n=1 Tax=Ixodes persulcatus TaxID=34615 RepID=A0AC60NXN2_IXOPE|nr:hypothetical protein HPB47_010972 [Ixodes persulcatus]
MDSARSWLVAGACCWINVFSCAMVVSSGIVYVNILQTLDVTREQASWPVSLMTNVYMVAEQTQLPIVMIQQCGFLSIRLGARKLM